MKCEDFKHSNSQVKVRINPKAQYNWQEGRTGTATLCGHTVVEMQRGVRTVEELTALVMLDVPYLGKKDFELYLFKLDVLHSQMDSPHQLELFE